MLKKVVLASVASVVLAGAAMTAPITAEAATTCKEAAKMNYPDSRKMRHAYKKSCKEAFKMQSGKTGLIGKLRLKKEG
jgi:hypothetical protein